MPISALIVRVSEAEALVSKLRLRHDPSAPQGVPAHITVLVPFKEPAAISSDDMLMLERIYLGLSSFTFTLAAIERWPETTFLAPEPADRFVELTSAVVQAFPGYLPYGGKHATVVPHLTVSDGSAQGAREAETELQTLLRRHGPVQARCREIELIENGSGTWKPIHVFRLANSDA